MAERITLADAYTRVYNWYRKNLFRLEGDHSENAEVARRLIQHMPEPGAANDLEMRAVLGEILDNQGVLQFGSRQADGEDVMANYAQSGVAPFGGAGLGEIELKQLEKVSAIWPYTRPGRPAFYRVLAEEAAKRHDFDGAWRLLELIASQQSPAEYTQAWLTVAEEAHAAGLYDRATDALHRVLILARERQLHEVQANTLFLLARTADRMGQVTQVEQYLTEAIQLFSQGPRGTSGEREFWRMLIGFYEDNGQPQQAEEARQQAQERGFDLTEHQPEPPPTGPPAAPTAKVLSDQWSKVDALGYESYARTLATLITHKETSPPLTIGIKAPWGAGKTSLMKIVQDMLDGQAVVTEQNLATLDLGQPAGTLTLRELLRGLKPGQEPGKLEVPPSQRGRRYDIPPRATVWFNAWKYQTSEQIWAGLAHCIISQVTARMKPIERERFWLRLQLQRIDAAKVRRAVHELALKNVVPWAAGVVAFLIFVATPLYFFVPAVSWWMGGGVTLLGVAKGVHAWFSKLSERVSGALRDFIREPDYEGKMGFLYLVESDMRAVLDQVATRDQPLVIFVDDLDRCAPRNVALVVEAINLFLSGDYPHCIFVLGMEPAMVAASLEVANKDLIEKAREFAPGEEETPIGWRFMDKIIQLPLVMPAPTEMDDYIRTLASDTGATAPPPVVAPAAERVAAVEEELRAASSATEVAQLAEQRIKEAPPEERLVLAEASRRAYADKLQTEDPVIQQFVKSAAELFHANPRQVKRYVNLFRFLCTQRQGLGVDRLARGLATLPAPTDGAVTKFVALSLHWPQALGLLHKTVEVDDTHPAQRQTLFSLLEAKAMELEPGKDADADSAWVTFLKNKGCENQAWMKQRAFRTFLATGVPISGFETSGLW